MTASRPIPPELLPVTPAMLHVLVALPDGDAKLSSTSLAVPGPMVPGAGVP